MDYGTGKSKRFVPAHEIADSLGSIKSAGLLMFHALTGCDTTSSFCGIGKKTAWSTWNNFPEVTHTFRALSEKDFEVTPDIINCLQKFVVLLYNKHLEVETVNEARRILFSQGTRTLENIPPTYGALLQHIHRAAYQAGFVWRQALNPLPTLPSPSLYGWKEVDGDWLINWTDLSEASDTCRELIKCRCKKKCSGNCKCKKNDLKCTALCGCRCRN